jgi:hypothetical protein
MGQPLPSAAGFSISNPCPEYPTWFLDDALNVAIFEDYEVQHDGKEGGPHSPQ